MNGVLIAPKQEIHGFKAWPICQDIQVPGAPASVITAKSIACLQGLQVGGQVPLKAGALLLAELGLGLDGAVKARQALLADVGCLQSSSDPYMLFTRDSMIGCHTWHKFIPSADTWASRASTYTRGSQGLSSSFMQ